MKRELLFEMINNTFQLVPSNEILLFFNSQNILPDMDEFEFLSKYYFYVNQPNPILPKTVYLKILSLLPFIIQPKKGNIYYCRQCHFYAVFPYELQTKKLYPLLFGEFYSVKYMNFFAKYLDMYKIWNSQLHHYAQIFTKIHHQHNPHCQIQLIYYQSCLDSDKLKNLLNDFAFDPIQLTTNYLGYLNKMVGLNINIALVLDYMTKLGLFGKYPYLLYVASIVFLLLNGYQTGKKMRELARTRTQLWKKHQTDQLRYQYSIRTIAKMFGFEYNALNHKIRLVLTQMNKKI